MNKHSYNTGKKQTFFASENNIGSQLSIYSNLFPELCYRNDKLLPYE